MKVNYLKKTILLMSAVFLVSNAQAQTVEKTPQGIVCESGKVTTRIEFYNPGMVRVLKSPTGQKLDKQSLVVIANPQNVRFSVNQGKGKVTLKSNRITVNLDPTSGQVSFTDTKGNILLNEKAGGATFTSFNDVGNQTFRVKQAYKLEKDEAIYGLGLIQNGKMSQRNQSKYRISIR